MWAFEVSPQSWMSISGGATTIGMSKQMGVSGAVNLTHPHSRAVVMLSQITYHLAKG